MTCGAFFTANDTSRRIYEGSKLLARVYCSGHLRNLSVWIDARIGLFAADVNQTGGQILPILIGSASLRDAHSGEEMHKDSNERKLNRPYNQRGASALKQLKLAIPLFFAVLALAFSAPIAMGQYIPASQKSVGQDDFAPRDPKLPTVFIVGDSTAAFHADKDHEGPVELQGWGLYLSAFFDQQKVNIVNAAKSGRSSRTYITEGHWQKVLSQVKPNDIVLIQIGQNDVFPINDDSRARGTLPGIGEETQEIENLVTHKHETVHTYGWYLRQYIRQTEEKGAYPILLSLTTRNVWKDGHIEVGVSDYRQWARTVSLEDGRAGFVDVSGIMARAMDRLGKEKAAGLYHDKVHLRDPGAFLAARSAVSGLRAMLDAPVYHYLSSAGEAVLPADEYAFHWPANPKNPTLWLLGDSTVRNGDGTGVGGMWGWGDELDDYFNKEKINITNAAVSGRSSRTYYTMDWPFVRPYIQKGDVVLMQFGHNDMGDPDDAKRARASLPGIGEQAQSVDNPITGEKETVHTYGWYLHQLVAEIRAIGATPVICTPVPRNKWDKERIHREYPVEWARQIAHQLNVPLVDLNERIAQKYETLGKERTTELFADKGTHTTLDGAKMNAAVAMDEMEKSISAQLKNYLSTARGESGIHAH